MSGRLLAHHATFVVVSLLACVVWPSFAWSQAAPGTAGAFRIDLASATACYDQVDYRCVINVLEGPLLVRQSLPDGLAPEEIELAYELLGLGYLSVGLDAEGARTFDRLLDWRPDYVLTRTDASPQQVALVNELRLTRAVGRDAADLAAHVAARARLIAALPRLHPRAVIVAMGMLGKDVADIVSARASWVSNAMADPPWGPLTVFVEVSGEGRALFGDDASAWGFGGGVSGRVGVRYRPLFVALSMGWTRHQSLLAQPVISPAPALDVGHVQAEAGFSWLWGQVSLRTGLVVGLEWLHATPDLQSLNPLLGGFLGGYWEMGANVSLVATMTSGWTLGTVSDGQSSSLGASFSTMLGLGVGYSFR